MVLFRGSMVFLFLMKLLSWLFFLFLIGVFSEIGFLVIFIILWIFFSGICSFLVSFLGVGLWLILCSIWWLVCISLLIVLIIWIGIWIVWV